MKQTADTYLDGQNFMDVRIIGTLGLTEADLEAVGKIPGVEDAEGICSGDFLTEVGGTEKVLTAISVPEDISCLYVEDGRLPLKSGECFLDDSFAKACGYKVGDTITLYSGTEDPIEDSLKQDTYTIVGIGKNPYYLTYERGASSIGNGAVAGYLALPKSDFLSEAYVQIYVRSDEAEVLSCYSDDYEEWVDRLQESIETIADERCKIRYEEVVVAGREEVADARARLADGLQQLDDAQAEIDENRSKLEEAQAEYDAGMAEIEAKEKELSDGKIALEQGRLELERQEEKYEQARTQVVVMETMLQTARSAYEQMLSLYYELLSRIAGQEITNEEELKAWLEANQGQFDPGEIGELEGLDPEELIQVIQEKLAESRAQIDELVNQVAEARAQLDAASEQLIQAKVQIKTAELQIEEGEAQLNQGKLSLAEAKHELEDGRAQLEEGEAELAEARAQFEEENAEALAQIAEAEEKLDGIDYPEWYVLDRGTIQTYVEFGQDAESIGKLAQVFPVIFFLVAALVSLTTMTRMVEEERLQIGTMKALGYGKGAIMSKYVLYALSASVIGSILGILIGGKLIPFVIIAAYRMMYEGLIGMVIPYRMDHALTASLVAVGCTVGATLLSCYKELLAAPAALMRPAAPKQGRRVLLERIGFLWKHLNFSTKSTIRNLMRYKKRFFMTIFGIGACMALLMVGFGLRDSLMVIVSNQYKTIWMYDLEAGTDAAASGAEREALTQYLEQDENITGSIRVQKTSMDFEFGGTVRAGTLVVPEDTEKYKEFVSLRNMNTQEPLSLGEEGAVITEKLSRVFGVEPGDTIYLKVSDTEEYAVRVTGITEQYSQHFVYMSPAAYEKAFGKVPEYNKIAINMEQVTAEEEARISSDLLALDAVQSVGVSSVYHEQMANMLHSLDLVVCLLILSAGLLAFVVLYNLNNINITERRRELATLKVLGFYDQEVAMYVYRENVILTLLGIAVGVFLGMWLHRYVITTVEIDMLLFGRKISMMSYVYGCLLTVFFAVIVNVSMFYKLRKIDMVESLKSVE